MCGIVGAAAQRNVSKILLEGLKRLEYRGYDSAGLAVIEEQAIGLRKAVGKVSELVNKFDQDPIKGIVGIAHTRWATHGAPSEINAHPHSSDHIAVVHNGIIENHEELRQQLKDKGYDFVSETDTEVVAHLIHSFFIESGCLKTALRQAVGSFDGAYALGVISAQQPDTVVCARSGSPLVVGVGIDENFIASDQLALRQVTDRFIFLEEGDLAEVTTEAIRIFDQQGESVERPVVQLTDVEESADKGEYRHYMLKEIHEQPRVLGNTLQGRVSKHSVLEEAFGAEAKAIFDQVEAIQILACGTSYHAGMIAKYWFEDWAGIPCAVEVASEYRYRKTVVRPNTLFVSVSQSGETADTLAALRGSEGYLASLTVCNVANSSLVRESDLCLMTLAGPEIGVASTKAFTTQLVALQLLVIALGRRAKMTPEKETELVQALHALPELCEKVLKLDAEIQQLSEAFSEKHHALFLGRGVEYPVAKEGALKLKEISYIHAEAYPAGELKHGPLALVDSDMPVVAVAPNDQLLEKLKSNLEEVQARGGKLFVFADEQSGFANDDNTTVLLLPDVPGSIAPIIYTLPLQLLSYHVAILKGTDVDQPRNLAKSVTVE
ncbi:glutamine--fructose-6-phosphate transaminase (isomerizing) [Pseudomaricurvus alkylphenolicus]|jgi:glucosamine--fructose-6-phosphate aminotransferase (isomerizing)|uniref:glutamine--fructose-6-phosphate transaminase (isomerizing) n=1 Tax=Pseudomaricurvus alkylphenolicus TaxID=1306991 RepID=UPI00141E0C03|nr:glutamine--fructose-6-phosphate transaminase (isomerizing) [Pseudomaricurvus alkylphenolicus]NIB39475.1 glutamine--fructose-6-phosphate transaminase (isomerizing) [Pseudomaricurvus alkylphenolicus]